MKEGVVMRLIDTREAAKILGTSPRTVSIWLKNNLLPGYKLGIGNRADWRINKTDLLNFLKSRGNLAQKKIDEEKMDHFKMIMEQTQVDDELLTDDDIKAMNEADEDIRMGRTIAIEELSAQNGINE
jgi:excisionase family DNA binding protein